MSAMTRKIPIPVLFSTSLWVNCFCSLATSITGENTRHLRTGEEKFIFYQPITTVIDHALIDLDQQALEEALAQGNFGSALEIYQEGAFSQSYAILELDQPLPMQVRPGTDVKGNNDVEGWVTGTVKELAEANTTTLVVEYHVSPKQEDIPYGCHVGANPNPNAEGCFMTSGVVEIGTLGLFEYYYDPFKDNHNARTLQSFSTQAKELMWDCQFGASHSNCPYPTYSKFYQYYGVFDYGNQWIQAAFEKRSTQFSNGNADFSAYTDEGRAEAIKRATIQMNLWMMVIREMEHAIEICQYTKDEDDHLFAWDKAVAYYTGSVAKGAAGLHYEGYSLYTLAEERCMFANTCLQESNFPSDHFGSIAQVNEDILKNFNLGQSVLLDGHCEAAKTMSARIMTDMMVPLIQGVLRYAYQMDVVHEMDSMIGQDLEAEGAVFTASILPLIHSCNPSDADRLHDIMGVGNGQDVDFSLVKILLEQNYECLGLTCEDIGGIVDVTGAKESYLKYGEPCGYTPVASNQDLAPNPGSSLPGTTTTTSTNIIDNNNTVNSTSDGPNVKVAVGIVVAFVAAGIILTVFVSRAKRGNKEFDGPSTEWS